MEGGHLNQTKLFHLKIFSIFLISEGKILLNVFFIFLSQGIKSVGGGGKKGEFVNL